MHSLSAHHILSYTYFRCILSSPMKKKFLFIYVYVCACTHMHLHRCMRCTHVCMWACVWFEWRPGIRCDMKVQLWWQPSLCRVLALGMRQFRCLSEGDNFQFYVQKLYYIFPTRKVPFVGGTKNTRVYYGLFQRIIDKSIILLKFDLSLHLCARDDMWTSCFGIHYLNKDKWCWN